MFVAKGPMPTPVTKIQLFVASPADVDPERERLHSVVQELNNAVAASVDLVLEVVKYETHTHPGMGVDPQDVVNRQIQPTDIFIGIMWKRFGTKTKRAESGTLEEFERARERWKSHPEMHILFYFNQAPYSFRTKQETTQAGKVLAFQQSLGKTALSSKYTGVQEFESLVRQHLTQIVLAWHKTHGSPIASANMSANSAAAAAAPDPGWSAPSPATPPSVAKPAPASPPQVPIVASKSVDAIYNEILSDDPTQSLPAAQRLMELPNPDLGRVIGDLRSSFAPPREFAVRLVLARFPEKSAALLIEKVSEASPNWNGALAAAALFTPAHRPFAADLLAKKLTSDVDFDVGRMCIESLGYMGAAEWAYSLLEAIHAKGDPHQIYFSEYTYEKYNSYVAEALARMFVLSQGGVYDEPSVQDLEDGLAFLNAHRSLERNPLLQRALATILGKGKPVHGDIFVRRWIRSDKPYLKQFAIFAVGFMRFSRATQALKEIAADLSEDEYVWGQAMLALSNIRTPDSIQAVIAGFDTHPEQRSALAAARCLEAVEDDAAFRRLCRSLLDFNVMEKCWVYRACGLRRAAEFRDTILAALHSDEQSDRAHAALALARLDPGQHRALLQRAYEEAATHMDKILTGLALLLDDKVPYSDVLEEIRKQLQLASWAYQRPTREDIINVLGQHKSPEAQLLSSCWKQIYAGRQDY
jgi:hypothetical protein